MRRSVHRLAISIAALCIGILCGGSCQLPSTGSGGDFLTTVYMTEDEALRTVFPDAARRVSERLELSSEERRAAETILEGRILEPSFLLHAGIKADGSLDGFALILEEVGKFKPFRFIVGLEPDGSVRRVAVLIYRESRGGEIAHRRFLAQYPGRRAGDPLRGNRDIVNISGATMSVNALNLGVKKALAVVSVVYLGQPHRIARLLEIPGTGSASGETRPRREAKDGEGAMASLVEAREARFLMGALCEIRAYGQDRDQLRSAIYRAFDVMESADRALSDYKSTSELSELARRAGGESLEVSTLTGKFLELANRVARESGGAFDVTVGPLVRAWGGRGSVATEPTRSELDALRALVDPGALVLETASGGYRARLARPGMALDPGALGKGYAVDLAVNRLRESGVEIALLDFAGNMYALGAPPGLDGWPIAVRDPVNPGRTLGILHLRDAGIASSGSYERHGEVGGRIRSHIVSPRTLEPVEGVYGTSVIAPTAALADGYSTAAFVLASDARSFLEARPGVEGIVALDDHGSPRIIATRGWRLE